jgi:AraC-binding-like domain
VNSPNPLDNFPAVRSGDIEVVRDAIGRVYARPSLTPTRGTAGFNAVINNCRLRHIALAYSSYSAPVSLEFPATDLFAHLLPIRGTGEIVCGNAETVLEPWAGVVVSPGVAHVFRYSADYAHLVLRIDGDALTRKLTAMTGAAVNVPIRTHAEQDFRHPAARMLQQYIPLLIQTLGETDLPYPDWWILQTEQLLMTLFLCGHRHNYSHLFENEAPAATPQQVRWAEEYIEANAQRGIGLGELAAVTGVSEFSLYRSFKHSRGYSPLEFAVRQRARRGSAEC